MAKQRVKELKTAENQKLIMEIKEDQAHDMRLLAESQQMQLKEFNEKMDMEFFKIAKYYDEQEPLMKQHQQDEIHKRIEEINAEFEKNQPKPNVEVLQLQRTLDLLVRQKEYT